MLTSPPRETCLVVPGDASRRHGNALRADPDEVVFDLEDAVTPGDRPAARTAIAATLADAAWHGRAVAVRVNPPASPDHAADLDLCRALSAEHTARLSVVVPKVEDAATLEAVADALHGAVAVQALIETPAGVEAAAAIARARCRVEALIIGYADLTASLGRRERRRPPDRWVVVQERVLHAARAAGVAAIDGPYVRLGDRIGLAAAAARARALGFDGAWAIHPEQLPILRQAFAPTADELARATAVSRTLAAARTSVARVNGEMVDEATRREAVRMLRRGRDATSAGPRGIAVDAPYYEDLARGDRFTAPGLTLTDGHVALHQAIAGDRLALATDRALARDAGAPGFVHPMLVANVAIGQSTGPSARVLGNLFYRGLTLAPVTIGATLRTTTTVVAKRRAGGREPRGLVVLRLQTVDDNGRIVVDALRCPLLPARGAPGPGERDDDLTGLDGDVGAAAMRDLVPEGWDLRALRALAPAGRAVVRPGDAFDVEARDTVTAAPELARLTLNVAMAHLDDATWGERLVYGGHVIAVAAAHLTRVLPHMATILAWRSCDHLGPVLEGDRLRSVVTIDDVHTLPGGRLLGVRVRTTAERDELVHDVLDWRPVVLLP